MNGFSRENVTDILCIGAQKASTSWLHNVLNAHPATYAFPHSAPITSTNKEAHFWDWNRKRGIDWYRNLMTPQDAERLSMDFTPEYAMMSDAQIRECKEISPSARVIYVLRDPLARAISALRMHTLWKNRETKPEEVEIALDEGFFELLKKARIAENTSYFANYERWAYHYDNILVLNYEDIRTNPRGVIDQLFSHCGLSVDEMPPEAREEFDKRMNRRVWASVRYPVRPDVAYFLHGLLWPKRVAAERFFKVEFKEYQEILRDSETAV